MATATEAPHTNKVSNVNEPQVTSFASAAAAANRPRKEYAVILESIPGCSNDDYLDGIENIVDLKEVSHISKISGERICIFLRNEQSTVLLINKKRIKVKEYLVNIRPLIEKNKRVVISNVNPIIPNDIVLKVFLDNQISPVSSLSSIRAGLSKPGREHILSFRRQIFIKEEDESLLPESAQINYDNTTYSIYFSTDTTLCFYCKQSGHIRKMCPLLLNNSSVNFPHLPSKTTVSPNTPISLNRIDTTMVEEPKLTNLNHLVGQTRKRSLTPGNINIVPPVASPGTNLMDINHLTGSSSVEYVKRRKSEEFTAPIPLPALNVGLESARVAFESSRCQRIISFDRFMDFVDKSKNYKTNSSGPDSLLALQLKYTDNTQGLLSSICIIYPEVDKYMKSKLTRLKRKLKKIILSSAASEDDHDTGTETDGSQSQMSFKSSINDTSIAPEEIEERQHD